MWGNGALGVLANRPDMRTIWLQATVGHGKKKQMLDKLSSVDLCRELISGEGQWLPLRVRATLMYGIALLHRSHMRQLLDQARCFVNKLKKVDGYEVDKVAKRKRKIKTLEHHRSFIIDFGLMPPFPSTPPPPEIGLSVHNLKSLDPPSSELELDIDDTLRSSVMLPSIPATPLVDLDLDLDTGVYEPYVPDELSLQFEPDKRATVPSPVRSWPDTVEPGLIEHQPRLPKVRIPRYDETENLVLNGVETDYVRLMAAQSELKLKRRRIDQSGAAEIIEESFGPTLRLLSQSRHLDTMQNASISPEQANDGSNVAELEPQAPDLARTSSPGSVEHLRHGSWRLSSLASSLGSRSPPHFELYDDFSENGEGYLPMGSLDDLGSGDDYDNDDALLDEVNHFMEERATKLLQNLKRLDRTVASFDDSLRTKTAQAAANTFSDLLLLADRGLIALHQDSPYAAISVHFA